MHNDRAESLDPSQPALIVTYGFTPHRVRPLDGDLVLVGKGRACDLGLMSPEVAEMHCVLFRTAGGWRLRDGGSRLGTRVNGRAVHETSLGDGDVIQVGNFNFRMHLPDDPAPPARPVAAPPRAADAAGQADVERSLALLRERLREGEQKAEQMRQEERELAQDRAALDDEYAALQRRTDEAEQALQRRQSEVEADLRRRWQECEARCRERERQAAEGSGRPASGVDAEEARRVELRRRELDQYAAYLRRSRQELAGKSRAEADEVQELREQLAAAERTMRAELNRLREEVRSQGGQPAVPGRLTGAHRLKATMARMVGAPGGGASGQRDKAASNSRLPRVRLPRRGDG